MSSSVAPECNEQKECASTGYLLRCKANEYRRYDSCFLKWYSEKFLRGNSRDDDCADLFKGYQGCLRKALKERGIDAMLEDVRKDNKENDAAHLRKS